MRAGTGYHSTGRDNKKDQKHKAIFSLICHYVIRSRDIFHSVQVRRDPGIIGTMFVI